MEGNDNSNAIHEEMKSEENETTLDWAMEALRNIKDQMNAYEERNKGATVADLRGLAGDIILIEVKKLRQKIVEDFYETGNNGNVTDLVLKVCNYYGVTPDILELKSRKREVLEPRQLIHWMIRSGVVTNRMTSVAVGELTGGQDHATVLHSVRVINDRLATEREFREDVMRLCNSLGARTFWNGNRLEITRNEMEIA